MSANLSYFDDLISGKQPADDSLKVFDDLIDSKPSTKRRRSSGNPQFDSLYEQAGTQYGVDPDLLIEQGRNESINFNPAVVQGRRDSPKGARGIAQFLPGTARQFGLKVDSGVDERSDPTKAIPAQARMMKWLLDRHSGNTEAALAAYNSGHFLNTGAALRNRQRIPETRGYVDKITRALQDIQDEPTPTRGKTARLDRLRTENDRTAAPIVEEAKHLALENTEQPLTRDEMQRQAEETPIITTTLPRPLTPHEAQRTDEFAPAAPEYYREQQKPNAISQVSDQAAALNQGKRETARREATHRKLQSDLTSVIVNRRALQSQLDRIEAQGSAPDKITSLGQLKASEDQPVTSIGELQRREGRTGTSRTVGLAELKRADEEVMKARAALDGFTGQPAAQGQPRGVNVGSVAAKAVRRMANLEPEPALFESPVLTPEQQAQDRAEVEARLKSDTQQPSALSAVVRGMEEYSGGLGNTVANIVGILPGESAQGVRDYLKRRSQINLAAAHETPLGASGQPQAQSYPNEIIQELTSQGLNITQFMLLQKTTGAKPSTIMASEAALSNLDKPVNEQRAAIEKAFAFGKVLEKFHLGRGASAALFGVPAAAESLYAGEGARKASVRGVGGTAFGYALGGKPEGKETAPIETTAEPARFEPTVRETTEADIPEVPVSTIAEPRVIHHSNLQPRRIRNTETGRAGQFKKGRPDYESASSAPPEANQGEGEPTGGGQLLPDRTEARPLGAQPNAGREETSGAPQIEQPDNLKPFDALIAQKPSDTAEATPTGETQPQPLEAQPQPVSEIGSPQAEARARAIRELEKLRREAELRRAYESRTTTTGQKISGEHEAIIPRSELQKSDVVGAVQSGKIPLMSDDQPRLMSGKEEEAAKGQEGTSGRLTWQPRGKSTSPVGMTEEEFNATAASDRNFEGEVERIGRAIHATDADALPAAIRTYAREFTTSNPGLVRKFSQTKPSDLVTVYRALSTSDPNPIRPGDWIALERSYAEAHASGGYGDVGSKIIEEKIPANDIVWAGTDANEWIYAPQETRNKDVSVYDYLSKPSNAPNGAAQTPAPTSQGVSSTTVLSRMDTPAIKELKSPLHPVEDFAITQSDWDEIRRTAPYVSKSNPDTLVTTSPSTTRPGWTRLNFWNHQGIWTHLEMPDADVEKTLKQQTYPRGQVIVSVKGGMGGSLPSESYAGFGFEPYATGAKGIKAFVGPRESVSWMTDRLGSGGYKVEVRDVPEQTIAQVSPRTAAPPVEQTPQNLSTLEASAKLQDAGYSPSDAQEIVRRMASDDRTVSSDAINNLVEMAKSDPEAVKQGIGFTSPEDLSRSELKQRAKAGGRQAPEYQAELDKRDSTRTLAEFFRDRGGIVKGEMYAGEIARLSPKETETTGLLNRNARAGGRRQTAEDMMNAANEEGYRDENGQPFTNVGDFLQAVEMDAGGRGRAQRAISGDEYDYEEGYYEYARKQQSEEEARQSADNLISLMEREDTGVLYDKVISGQANDAEIKQFRGAAQEFGVSDRDAQSVVDEGEANRSQTEQPVSRTPQGETKEVGEPDFVRAARKRQQQRTTEKQRGIEYRRAGADPYELIDNLIIHGYELYAKTKPKFEEWAKEMRARFGEDSEPHLKGIYAQFGGEIREATSTSARQEGMAQDRAELDLPELPKAERKSWQTSLDNAKEKGLDERADVIADAVTRSPRALNDEETAGMVLRAQQIKNRHAEVMREIGQESDPVQIADKSAEVDALEKQFDKVTDALKKSGTEKGRVLASQKLTINQDYDLVSMLNRFKAKTGKEPSPEVRAKIESQAKEIESLQKQISEYEDKLKSKEAQRGINRIKDEVARESRKLGRTQKKVDLDTEFASLRAQFAQARKEISGVQPSGLAGLDPEGKLTKLIARMAKNRVKAGVNTIDGIVDDIHEAIKERVEGITKRDIRDAISGYGKTQEMSKDEVSTQLRDLRRQMRLISSIEDAEKGQRPERSGLQREKESERVKAMRKQLGATLKEKGLSAERDPLAAAKTRLENQIADIERQLQKGRDLKGASRVAYDKQALDLKAKRDALKKQLDEQYPVTPKPRDPLPAIKTRIKNQITEYERRIAEGDYSEKPKRLAIVYDREGNQLKAKLESVKRDFEELKAKQEKKGVLDYLVRWKRFAVLTYPTTLGKLGAAASGRMVQTPAEEVIGGVLSKIPGISRIAERAPREGGVNLRAEAKAISQLWQSDSFRSTLEQLKGGRDMLDLLYGHKTGDKEFMNLPGRSHGAIKVIPKRAEFFRSFEKRIAKAGKQGLDVADPDVQMGVAMEAYTDAMRAILMQHNPISDAFNRTMNNWKSKGLGGRLASAALRFEFPITRVPVNYVAEQSSLITPVGVAKGAAKLYEAMKREGSIKKGIANLKPEEADYILRAWKKAGVGLGMMALGYMKPEMFGGYYTKDDRRSKDEAQFGEVVVFGHHIPKWATHIPLIEAAQFGATIRRVRDARIEKGDTRQAAAAEGTLHAGWELTKEIPFVGQPEKIYNALDAPNKVDAAGKLAGEEVKSLIPGAVQQAAQMMDKDSKGEQIKRKPTNFKETVKSGIPWWRSSVPENLKAEKWDKTEELKDRARSGENTAPELNKLVKSGELSRQAAAQIYNAQKMTPLQEHVNKMQLEKAEEFYKLQSPTEQRTLDTIMRRKRESAAKERARGFVPPQPKGTHSVHRGTR